MPGAETILPDPPTFVNSPPFSDFSSLLPSQNRLKLLCRSGFSRFFTSGKGLDNGRPVRKNGN